MLEVVGTKRIWLRWLLLAILRFLLALLVISILTFILIYVTPGDPAESYLRASGIPYSPTAIVAVREQLGLNQPAYLQYVHWLTAVLQGNLGTSMMARTPVLTMIIASSKHTFLLGTISMGWLFIGSLGLALWCLRRPQGIVDQIIQGFSLVSVSFPNFFLGYLLILVFAAKLHWFPVSGMSANRAIILPSIALMMPMLGQTTLFLRKCFLDVLQEAHMENAILRGVSYRYLIKNHLLKNTAGAIVTMMSWNFLGLLTGSIIIESVFAWPGIGSLFVTAAQNGDTPVIQGTLLLFGVLAMIINTGTQVLVRWLDPRQRHQKRGVL